MRIVIGARVHRYSDDDTYDVGTVSSIENDWVVVDFYDWIERWPADRFVVHTLYSHGYDVLVPRGEGDIVKHFHQRDGGP